ncbi:MAG: hypothetical protein KDA78_08025 [Planctomycetaceae bacterium]|nr:hypothetical protein [Planctomycetaceae bacterium]
MVHVDRPDFGQGTRIFKEDRIGHRADEVIKAVITGVEQATQQGVTAAVIIATACAAIVATDIATDIAAVIYAAVTADIAAAATVVIPKGVKDPRLCCAAHH